MSRSNIKKILLSINTDSSKCITYFYAILNRESMCGDSFGDSKNTFEYQKVNSNIKI